MKIKISILLTIAVVGLAALALVACDRDDGPAEKAGKKVDNAASKASDAMGNVADKASKEVNNVTGGNS